MAADFRPSITVLPSFSAVLAAPVATALTSPARGPERSIGLRGTGCKLFSDAQSTCPNGEYHQDSQSWCGPRWLAPQFSCRAVILDETSGHRKDLDEVGDVQGGEVGVGNRQERDVEVASFALHAGLVNMVKSSLTGSILGNLVLGLGLSFFAGGIKYRRDQQFDPRAARMTTALLTLASFPCFMPGCR